MTEASTAGPWHFRRRFPDGYNSHEYVVQHEGPGDAFQEVVVINVGDDLQAPNQLADGYLISAAPQMAEVLRQYEQWGADVILSDEAWGGGVEPLPTIPQHLWDRLVEIQGMRNEALAKARGEDSQ